MKHAMMEKWSRWNRETWMLLSPRGAFSDTVNTDRNKGNRWTSALANHKYSFCASSVQLQKGKVSLRVFLICYVVKSRRKQNQNKIISIGNSFVFGHWLRGILPEANLKYFTQREIFGIIMAQWIIYRNSKNMTIFLHSAAHYHTHESRWYTLYSWVERLFRYRKVLLQNKEWTICLKNNEEFQGYYSQWTKIDT